MENCKVNNLVANFTTKLSEKEIGQNYASNSVKKISIDKKYIFSQNINVLQVQSSSQSYAKQILIKKT